MNPGTSITNTSGIANALQRLMKRAALSAASLSRIPPSCSRRVEQPDQRDPLGQRQLAQPRDLQLAGHPHRAGHHREVVRRDRRESPAHLAIAGDHAIGGCVDAVHRALGEVRAAVDAQLDKRPLVDQQCQPLARRQLPCRVLRFDPLRPAAEPDLLAARSQVLRERSQQAGRRCVGRHYRKLERTRSSDGERAASTLNGPSIRDRACRRRP
jgi:hypothetical protein